MDEKDLRKLAKALRKQGWSVEMIGPRRMACTTPDGEFRIIIWVSRDPRAMANAVAVLRRFGFQWPPR
ncbi:MAG: hypothetical protein ABIQ01_05255 [Pseudolysinimonas sp.]